MKICYDQGCTDIGVVIAMEWHHYPFCLQHWGLFFQNRSWKLFPPIATSMFVKFEWNVALTLLPYNMKIILRLKGLLKQRLISGISIFQKKSFKWFKNYLLICKVDWNVYKTINKTVADPDLQFREGEGGVGVFSKKFIFRPLFGLKIRGARLPRWGVMGGMYQECLDT